jgi:phosphoserine phosphatase
MNTASRLDRLSREDIEAILTVTRALAAPFELKPMLEAVAAAARSVLRAERCSVWLHDPRTEELILKVSSDVSELRLPAGTGLVGACAQQRKLINVPDCYADPRFDRAVDQRSGFRTRCMLALPLLEHDGTLVGVMQVLNKTNHAFNAADEALAEALAAQCAVALARVRMTEALIESEKVQQELQLARKLQMSTLPSVMPAVAGYDMHGVCIPASATGGDTFDLAVIDQGLLVVLADATGHGIAPALSVTQMHAMLRMAFGLGVDLETVFRRVNDQLADTLPDGHFVTTFMGLLDTEQHRLRFLSGGQGPILHFHAAQNNFSAFKATSFPLGAMHLQTLRPAIELAMEPGDVLLLVSDGIFEYEDTPGRQFGRTRVEQVILAQRNAQASEMAAKLLEAVHGFAGDAAQQDDMTIVIVRRSVEQ